MTEEDHDREYEILSSLMPRVVVTSMLDNPRAVKCPRCWHYHTVGENHDNLCDRCCHVMMNAWPGHLATPLIKANFEAQRAKYDATRSE